MDETGELVDYIGSRVAPAISIKSAVNPYQPLDIHAHPGPD